MMYRYLPKQFLSGKKQWGLICHVVDKILRMFDLKRPAVRHAYVVSNILGILSILSYIKIVRCVFDPNLQSNEIFNIKILEIMAGEMGQY